jgi:Flp pilus assembly protein TadG
MSAYHCLVPLVPLRIARLLRRLWKATDGIETVEFAIVSVVLFFFLLGVVEFGRLYWTQSELQYAAEATARCVTVTCCPGNAACGGSSGNTGYQNFATDQLIGIAASSSSLTNFSVASPAPACGNQITFNYQFTFVAQGLLLPLFPNGITLTAQACHQA